MLEFIDHVLYLLQNGILQAVVFVLLLAVAVGYYYSNNKEKYDTDHPFPWTRIILIMLLLGYLTIVYRATFGRSSGSGTGGFSFHLFRSWRDAWNRFSVVTWLNILLNIAMMIPLGVLLPLAFKRCRKWKSMLLSGLGVALYIETMQYFSGRGIFDADDLFNNSLGSMIGFFFLKLFLSFFAPKRKRWKCILKYGALITIPIVVIAGIFISYHAQEYGNLPQGYTYVVNTDSTEWELSCELSDISGTVPVYKMDKPTQEYYDSIRDEFEIALGVEFERTDYYDDSIYYMDQRENDGSNGVHVSHFLHVHRIDGTYEYTIGDDSAAKEETDRDTIEYLLGSFNISIPPEATFLHEQSGYHSFTADMLMEDSVLVDGELRCVYREDGILSEINNYLITCTYHNEVEIISPQDAFEKMCRGEFSDERGAFEDLKPPIVIVQSCTLDYLVDTKGFYQPVYLFSVSFEEAQYESTIMIPAM